MKTNYDNARKLIKTPLCICTILAFCWAIQAVWGYYYEHGYYASSFVNSMMRTSSFMDLISVVSLFGSILAPIPCLILSVKGSRLVCTAAGSGDREAKKLYRLAFISEAVSIIMTILALLIIPLGGIGV